MKRKNMKEEKILAGPDEDHEDSRSKSSEKASEKEFESRRHKPQQNEREDPSHLAAIRSRSRNPHPPLSRPQTLCTTRSERSYGGEDGYSCFHDDDQDAEARPNDDEEKQFEVKWDGESDPMNPRNRKKAQKWMIVLIMASSALCV
jgi:hypothetical protein